MTYKIESLPYMNEEVLETKAVLKKAAHAHRYLAELKGIAASIPNESIIINTLTMQEAKDSSEVENIVTTDDQLYKVDLFTDYLGPEAKEVQRYAIALKRGFEEVRKTQLIRINDILEIQKTLEGNNAGFRQLPGTELKNQKSGEVVYTPPQDHQVVSDLMANLIEYLNNNTLSELDPLVKMAIIHFQFESIHPFYDGNGRTGRIINILYLIIQDLLDLPVLYLSSHIIQNKSDYYLNLQSVRDEGAWEAWLLYMIDGIEQTSRQTIRLIRDIKSLMLECKHGLRKKLPKIYSQGLLNNLFRHPYTKIEFIVNEIGVSRLTASKYLEQLVEKGFLEKQKLGRSNYYINNDLCRILSRR